MCITFWITYVKPVFNRCASRPQADFGAPPGPVEASRPLSSVPAQYRCRPQRKQYAALRCFSATISIEFRVLYTAVFIDRFRQE